MTLKKLNINSSCDGNISIVNKNKIRPGENELKDKQNLLNNFFTMFSPK